MKFVLNGAGLELHEVTFLVSLRADFSEEIANQTLAERPNSLYKKVRNQAWWQQYQDTSTESEEVDSDSGYSSPLHRRNQTSNGTHPVLGVTFIPPGMPPDIHRAPFMGPPGPGGLYPPFMGPGPPHHFPQYPPPLGNPQMGPYMKGYPTTNSAASHRKHMAAYDQLGSSASSSGANLPCSAPSVGSLANPNSNNNKTEPEEEDALSASGKKKRRRNRRKKKKNSADDTGALSDEPYELHNAHSSSNVSRTSYDPDVNLHFEDEEEFPNLMSGGATSPGALPQGASNSTLSYSDILKTRSVPVSGNNMHTLYNIFSNMTKYTFYFSCHIGLAIHGLLGKHWVF